MPSLKRAPMNPYLASPLQTSGLKKRIGELLNEITQDIISNKQSLAEAETLSKITTVAKLIRYVDYKDIEELYHQFASKDQSEEDQTRRNIFLDCTVMAGTNPALHLIIDLIHKNELRGEKAAELISAFPSSMRTPTPQILKVFFDKLVDSSINSQEEKWQVKTAAILALSKILYNAGVNTEIANSKYPVRNLNNENLILNTEG